MEKSKTRFFIAGIMQGSHTEARLHQQEYRRHLVRLLSEHFPDAEIYDPLANHAASLEYDDQTGREVFLLHNRMCGEVDVLVAFVPEASMGTAIEMWEAYRHGAVVVTISPLEVNWAVRFLSHVIYHDVAALEAALASGQFPATIAELLGRRQRS